MRQRVMFAIATAARPRLLLADEPTTALDVTTQAQILALLARLREETGMATVLVSHDFGVIAQACDSVAVMYAGYIVEATRPSERSTGGHITPTRRGCSSRSPASRRRSDAGARLSTIPGQPPELSALPDGCPFQPRCPHARSACREVSMRLEARRRRPRHGVPLCQESGCLLNRTRGSRGHADAGDPPLLVVKGLQKEFRLRRSATDWARRAEAERVVAVDNLSFTLRRGETLGIAGESGSGKTTAVRCLIRLIEPDGGEVSFAGYRCSSGLGRHTPRCAAADADGLPGPLCLSESAHARGRRPRRGGTGTPSAGE